MSSAGIAQHRGSRPITDRMRAAVRLVNEGATRSEVARLYGIGRETLDEWLLKILDEQRLVRCCG